MRIVIEITDGSGSVVVEKDHVAAVQPVTCLPGDEMAAIERALPKAIAKLERVLAAKPPVVDVTGSTPATTKKTPEPQPDQPSLF